MPLLFNTFRRNEGNYNWADPSEKGVCYQFYLLPDAPIKNFGVVIDLDEDPDHGSDDYTALDTCYMLQDILKRYLFSSSRNELATLIPYLESRALEDELAWLKDKDRQAQDQIKRLEYEISDRMDRIAELEAKLEVQE